MRHALLYVLIAAGLALAGTGTAIAQPGIDAGAYDPAEGGPTPSWAEIDAEVSDHAVPVPAPTVDSAPIEAARYLWHRLTAGELQWYAVAGAVLLVLISLFRWLARARKTGAIGDWLHATFYGSDLRGTATTLLLALLGTLATSWAAGEAFGAAGVWVAVGAGVTAAGGYSVVWRRLLLPLARKIPGLGEMFPPAPGES